MNNNPAPQKILIVDDVPINITILGSVLKDEYEVKVATNGADALEIAMSDSPPDLILLDIMMPEMDGFEVCRRLKSSVRTHKIPVIFVTGLNSFTDEMKGFEIGAVDYIAKPISAPVVQARVKTHLAMYDQSRILEHKVRERTNELIRTQDVTIHSLAVLAECRDNETGGHIMRTQHYVLALAKCLQNEPRFRNFLDAETMDLLFKSAPLHDIGKVGIPDSILLKPGKLTYEEFEEMKKHTIYGEQALLRAESALGRDRGSSFLRYAREITSSHHEKWDGSGYPNGFSGEDIPFSGRVMALADVYDALVSRRVYKPPFPHEKAFDIIVNGDGRVMPDHFDPDVLKAFVKINETFREIALKYADSSEEREVLKIKL